MTRIALIHATPVSIAPIATAFAAHWPAADTPNILDDSLSADQARDGDLTEAMRRRFQALADYSLIGGADGILFTCSAFGAAIEAVQQRLDVPVLKPNEAMFRKAIDRGGKIAMLVTFGPSVGPLRTEFEDLAHARQIELETILVEGAMAALADGDAATHNRLIADAAKTIERASTILLAQFSMAQAREAVEAETSIPVLTAPENAVLAMRACFNQP